MIKLYVYPAAFGLRNPSPFCLKAEMALRLAGFEHEIELLTDPRKAPKGKLPFVETEGERIADSELIVAWLDRRSGGRLLGRLSPAERARGTAFTRLAEEHLYWLTVASRWLDDRWWPNVERAFFGPIPAPVRAIAAPLVRRRVRRSHRDQGLGRHTLVEQQQFARNDLAAIDAAVEAGGFVAGDRITVFDVAVAAQLASLLDNRPATWLTEIAAAWPRVRDYAERIQAATNVYARERAA